RGGLDGFHPGGLFLAVEPTEVAEFTLPAQRVEASADSPAVLDEVDVERMPQGRWDEVGKDPLEFLVIEASQVGAEFAVRTEAGEDATDVCVGRENLPAERVHHDAVGRFSLHLWQGAEERLQLLVRPVPGRLQGTAAEGLA